MQGLLLDQITQDIIHLNDCLHQYQRLTVAGNRRFYPLYVSPSNISLAMLRGEPPPPTAWHAFNFVAGRNCYISAIADWGPVPHSELAMHTRIAGKPVKRYYVCALGPEPAHYAMSAAVEVEEPTGETHVTVGTVGELLPDEVRRSLGGFGREEVPSSLNYFMHGALEITTRDDLNIRICRLHLFYYPLLGAVYYRITYNGVADTSLTIRQVEEACAFVEQCVLRILPGALVA